MFSKVFLFFLLFVSFECVISFRMKLKTLNNKEKEDLKTLVESLADREYTFLSFCDVWKKNADLDLEKLSKYQHPYSQFKFIKNINVQLESVLEVEKKISDDFHKIRIIYRNFDCKSDEEQVNIQGKIVALKVQIDAFIDSVFKIYRDLDSNLKAEIVKKQNSQLLPN
ncbi:uncharacterized protein LOC106645581 [Copidosoma floridanum]|uniref:uncharacterized protein LOC106645581 n=1 Tax=Copidosoma floridanum TaxID=29053 RepID=UPI0006C95DBA|nr:uncharacterized protein LOC106645581 [Copidosoma floridanum]